MYGAADNFFLWFPAGFQRAFMRDVESCDIFNDNRKLPSARFSCSSSSSVTDSKLNYQVCKRVKIFTKAGRRNPQTKVIEYVQGNMKSKPNSFGDLMSIKFKNICQLPRPNNTNNDQSYARNNCPKYGASPADWTLNTMSKGWESKRKIRYFLGDFCIYSCFWEGIAEWRVDSLRAG